MHKVNNGYSRWLLTIVLLVIIIGVTFFIKGNVIPKTIYSMDDSNKKNDQLAIEQKSHDIGDGNITNVNDVLKNESVKNNANNPVLPQYVFDVRDVTFLMRVALGLEELTSGQRVIYGIGKDEVTVRHVLKWMRVILGIEGIQREIIPNFFCSGIDELPDRVKRWIKDARLRNGESCNHYLYRHDGLLYILVTYDENKDPGCGTGITDISEEEDYLIVTYHYLESDEYFYIYPYDVVVIEDKNIPIIFKTTGAKTIQSVPGFQRPDRNDLSDEINVWVDDAIGEFSGQTYEYDKNLYILVTYVAPYFGYDMAITQLTKRDEKLYVVVYINKPIDVGLPAFENPYDLIVIKKPGIPVQFEAFGIESDIPTDK